jgi:hypothetical protein
LEVKEVNSCFFHVIGDTSKYLQHKNIYFWETAKKKKATFIRLPQSQNNCLVFGNPVAVCEARI